ncbi:hypothetical protein [Chitinophaga deserti]|uniref:hypothetical protein n=1 Tax=Chitinophaga deserti TaxID=2164099 RepID=UPI0018E517AB|nr:hypothetical protein [Chitinophaga deserti]
MLLTSSFLVFLITPDPGTIFFWIFSGIIFIVFLRGVFGKKGRRNNNGNIDTSAGVPTTWGTTDTPQFNSDGNHGGFDGYSGGDGGGGGASGDWSDSGGDSGGGDSGGGDGGGGD